MIFFNYPIVWTEHYARCPVRYTKKRVYEKAEEFFGDRQKALKWLKTPAKAFEGKTPEEKMTEPGGNLEVIRLLDQLAHGVIV